MKVRPTLLAMIAAISISSYGYAEMLRVTIRKAPIRSAPTSTSKLVTTAMEGTLLELVDRDGSWYIVSVPQSGKVGYVHRALVEIVLEPTPESAPAEPAPAPAPRPTKPPPAPRRVTAPPPPPTTTAPPPRRVYPEPAPAPTPEPAPVRRIAPRSTEAYGNPCAPSGYGRGTACGDLQFRIKDAEARRKSGVKLALIGIAINVGAVVLSGSNTNNSLVKPIWYVALGAGALTAYGGIKWFSAKGDANELDREGRMNRCWAVLPTRDGVRAAMTLSW